MILSLDAMRLSKEVDNRAMAYSIAFSIGVRVVALLMSAAAVLLGADAMQWGKAENGLRLGIEATTNAEPGWRVVLKNISPVTQEVAIGHQDHDVFYNIRFVALDRRGEKVDVFDLNALRRTPSDIGPGPTQFAVLEPGGLQEFVYPLSQLIGVLNQKETPISRLAKQGYRIHAIFDFRDTAVVSGDLPF